MKERIIAVGDLHGDWGKLNALIAKRRPDIALQVGDFGWWPQLHATKPVLYGQQKPWDLRGIKTGGATVYWCDGNHEQHPALPQDGGIHEMYENVLYCSRGSTITLPDGRTVLFAGGATSVDRSQRTPGHDWFPEESISQADLERMLKHDTIDIVVSHTCPAAFDIRKNTWKEKDPSRDALQAVLEQYNPELWVFGHWHMSARGHCDHTEWYCLDYPRKGATWWMDLPAKDNKRGG